MSAEEARAAADPRLQLLQEMRPHNLDMIRFASYRTACKLRYVQKRANLHAVDIWNVIEAFRENGLNTLEPQTEVNVSRLETLVSSLYHNLNKRLPVAQQVHVEACSSLLLNWLLAAYAVENVGKIRVFSIKVALATMCAGKLMDKLRYIFSQISDGNGHMIVWRFSEYLQEVLALPAAVYESPSFSYSDGLANSIFPGSGKVTVNDFMDTMMSDPGPPCLVWLPLLHRLASVETVVHPMACDACQREGFAGFRYRCQKCHSYQLCQDCFWRGRVSGPHTNDHEVKEYTTYKSPSKQIGHSLRKSFRCVPEKGRPNIPRFPEEPEKTLNLSHIVPPSPLPSHNGFPESSFTSPFDGGSMDSRSTVRSAFCTSSPGKYTSSLDSTRLDDEHRLIARYAARLAAEARTVQQGRATSEGSLSLDTSQAQRELISQLEAKNREIMREIARLRRQQELEAAGGGSSNSAAGEENPALVAELRALRQRKEELETHLGVLQDSRRQLMVQLEGLMKLLKNHQASPRSTPNSSPRSTKSPPLPPGAGAPSSRSAPPTPGGQLQPTMMSSLGSGADSLTGVGGDVRSAFGASSGIVGSSTSSLAGSTNNSGTTNSSSRSLRNDLLVAADSVTNAMSTLVRELNSEGSDQEDGDDNIRKPLDFETEDGESDGTSNTAALWREEIRKRYEQESQFIAELRARNLGNGQEFEEKASNEAKGAGDESDYEQRQNALRRRASGLTDDDSYKEDDDSYTRTDDDDGSTDWEEAMKRWVNR
ncbi:dystrobrevin beta isoform X1 [Schistocerca serialis cubense]|uniref:dystrobrevin beta isoform X1 n=1 Tax=Schistocerca serialis cubense TaxID=2023355 RepID=UPI00214E2F0E|nr:dystrobrevin beta isoform X1 [Schistocerca serialis cubense]XP_049940518.1 dystrobrevin beta isoform X1 [Schistocerca serialis cubense]